MSVLIRPAVAGDVSALAQLAKDTFCETFVQGFAVGYPEADLKAFLANSYAHKKVAAWIADTAGQVLVAEQDGGLVAYAHSGENTLPYTHARLGDGELKRIYVRRSAQGGGLGRLLLEQALDWLGSRPVLIGVWSENHKALRLYARYGFEEAGTYKFMVGAVADAELILRRG